MFSGLPASLSFAQRTPQIIRRTPGGAYIEPGIASSLAAALEASDHLQRVAGERWIMTAFGVQSMRSCSVASAGRPVFARCATIPLEDMTTFQLSTEMSALGWQWRLWVPASQRSKRAEPIPQGYILGDSKLWYSGVEVSKLYLIALLRAEDRCAWFWLRHNSGEPFWLAGPAHFSYCGPLKNVVRVFTFLLNRFLIVTANPWKL